MKLRKKRFETEEKNSVRGKGTSMTSSSYSPPFSTPTPTSFSFTSSFSMQSMLCSVREMQECVWMNKK